MKKKALSENDVCSTIITPALIASGWKLGDQVRQEVLTKGQVIMNDGRIQRDCIKRADYVLYSKGKIPLAIIEAKDNSHNVEAGIQQAIQYSEMLDAPFAYSSNGDAFIEYDRTGLSPVQREIKLKEFPGPQKLWKKYQKWKGINEETERVITEEYNEPKKLRYYQEVAVNRAVEAIAKGQKRVLLVMAPGTGKTVVVSQIIYKLWKSKTKKRILFLADRNMLVEQARNVFGQLFGPAMTRIVSRRIDPSYEIYLSTYQALAGSDDGRNFCKTISKDFFDLIVIDECHRSSAVANSVWREVLDYFKSATQIGMTATPREDKEASNIDYFGEPIFVYSLKQGIEDGFLSPYRVIRVSIDKEIKSFGREKREHSRSILLDKANGANDLESHNIIDKRIQLVGKIISDYLKRSNRMDKTIVFCSDIDHAERMRKALVKENKDLVDKNPKYVIRITSDDELGKKELQNFIDPSSAYPVIVTTSKLLSTGADIQTCKLIVLDSNIQSMTDFKQIIGRGTTIREDYGKYFFTIMDFRNVTDLFADPSFDGKPVQIVNYNADKNSVIEVPSVRLGQGQILTPCNSDQPSVKDFNSQVEVGKHGKSTLQSLKENTKRTAQKEFGSLEQFIRHWNQAEYKTDLIREMVNKGILLNDLTNNIGNDLDPFDVILNVVYGQSALTRKQRVHKVKSSGCFLRFNDRTRAVVDALLDKYLETGIESIESLTILKVQPFTNIGTPLEIVSLFGGKDKYLAMLNQLKDCIYGVR